MNKKKAPQTLAAIRSTRSRERIPATRMVVDKKAKSLRRSTLKAATRKEVERQT